MPLITSLPSSAFQRCSYLQWSGTNLPAVVSVGYGAFSSCGYLYSIPSTALPAAKILQGYAFYNCYRLSYAYLPSVVTLSSNAFGYCSSLATVSFPALTYISASVFIRCSKLRSVYLLGSSVPTLYQSAAFSSTPIALSTYTGGYGSIFVRESMLDTFKATGNWSYYSNRFVGLTDDEISALDAANGG